METVITVVQSSCYFTVLFFFNDTATTEIYTLSLHDALPIFYPGVRAGGVALAGADRRAASARIDAEAARWEALPDRKSTRLNSSHANISYAVFCLKKKKTWENTRRTSPSSGAR